MEEFVVEFSGGLVRHGAMEVRLRTLHLVVESELADEHDLVVILYNIRRPLLILLVPPQARLEQLGDETIDVEDVVVVGDSAEHEKPAVDLGHDLLVSSEFGAKDALHDETHSIFDLPRFLSNNLIFVI